ncbi:hypothetical protein [Agrobacterium fabrum]|uniref:hypothetical protein n=1 Tax=Agrobacterium fabrum TaxID=1176649 RepID=UPI003BA2A455
MNAILQAFSFLDAMNATMAPSYSDDAVMALGESLAVDIKLLGHDLLIRHKFSEAAPPRPTIAIWIDIDDGYPQAKLGFGDRERADWPSVVPPDAILVPFSHGLDLDGVPIDKPTLQQIGFCSTEEQWQTCFRSTGFVRSLLLLAESRDKKTKSGVAA